METDTLPYDADGAAWDVWKVPTYQSGCKNQTFEVSSKHPPEDDAVAPTIPYDTVCNMDPELEGAVGDATLAYEAGAPGEMPEVSTFTSMPPPAWSPPAAAAIDQEAPTLAYGDTLVLQPEDDADQAAPMEPCPEAVPEAVPAPAEMAEQPSCISRSSESPQPREVAGTGPRTEKSGHGRISASGLRLRLWHKQPPPTGYVPPRRASRAKPKARSSAPAKRSAPSVAPADPHSVTKMVGCRVSVTGDGWGGGTGEYEATVVDSDDLSLTVIYRDDDKKWKETHVLRQHCDLLDAPQAEPASRRRTI
ncbi:unnamed protein product [Symbiodinium sp. CCMP2592]|nr:unnamed protein product [Symbiodinium sp. CCMP2592]